jgi:CheY-like chemotaxis protein
MSLAKQKTVLIVDDNHDAADTLALLIEFKGHKALIAYDAETGLALAHAAIPDIVIHDINLPGMNGYVAIEYLRADPKFVATVFVALTGFATPSDKKRALSAGFDYHMAKPMNFEQMYQLLA